MTEQDCSDDGDRRRKRIARKRRDKQGGIQKGLRQPKVDNNRPRKRKWDVDDNEDDEQLSAFNGYTFDADDLSGTNGVDSGSEED